MRRVGAAARGRHQRHELLQALGERRRPPPDPRHRHPAQRQRGRVPLAARAARPALRDLPEDLSGATREADRRRLARHLVQRRRADIGAYLDDDTPFPDATHARRRPTSSRRHARRSRRRARLRARRSSATTEQDRRRQRVRWWSALALLRSLASSPAAAAATLRTRADDRRRARPPRRPTSSAAAPCWTTPATRAPRASTSRPARSTTTTTRGAAPSAGGCSTSRDGRRAPRRRRRHEAPGVRSSSSRRSLEDGFSPIVFCRFIPTAEYVAEHLRDALGEERRGRGGHRHAPADRARGARRGARATHAQRVLVATDCLCEGINLQEHFDAVVHYDLAWNPTRHEQREGRVDRFGQRAHDGARRHLLRREQPDRRHRARGAAAQARARSAVSSASRCRCPPTPARSPTRSSKASSLRGRDDAASPSSCRSFAEVSKEHEQELHKEWDAASEREKRREHRLRPARDPHRRGRARARRGARRDRRRADVERFASAALARARRPRRNAPAGGLIADHQRGARARCATRSARPPRGDTLRDRRRPAVR